MSCIFPHKDYLHHAISQYKGQSYLMQNLWIVLLRLKGPHGFRKEKGGGARALGGMKHKWGLWEPFINPIIITLFRFITMLCGTDNISHNILWYFPHLVWMWAYERIFLWILLIPHFTVMKLNNIMMIQNETKNIKILNKYFFLRKTEMEVSKTFKNMWWGTSESVKGIWLGKYKGHFIHEIGSQYTSSTGRSLHCQVEHHQRTKFATPILHVIDNFKIYDIFPHIHTIDSIFFIYFLIFLVIIKFSINFLVQFCVILVRNNMFYKENKSSYLVTIFLVCNKYRVCLLIKNNW